MPAATVIPAPVAYIKVVAVKKLVVGFLVRGVCPAAFTAVCDGLFLPSFRKWLAALYCSGLQYLDLLL